MIRKEKGRVDVYGDRFRARAHQLTPRLLQVARYIHDNREAVMEQTAMEIATLLKTSDATVVRAIQALGFAGLRDLKQTLEQWFGPVVTSSEKMSTTVNTLASDVNASIDFVLEGHQHTCEVLSEPHNRYAMAQSRLSAGAGEAGRHIWHWRLRHSGRVHRQAVQPNGVTRHAA